jgi:ABC-type transport auxiliary lipoprotein component
MKSRALLLSLTLLLSGCIIFDKKSEAVTFHQLASPAAATTRSGPTVFVPRAIVPSALRRPNVVLIDDTGWVRIEDAHRWISPLDRAVPEAVGRHLTSLTGLPSSMQSPAEAHLLLLLTVDKMEIFTPAGTVRSIFSIPGTAPNTDTAILQLTFRLEKSDGTLLATKTLSHSHPLIERSPTAFEQAQSANIAAISAEIAKLLPAASSSK